MTITDHYGNALSTESQAARDHYDDGVAHFLSGNYGAVEAFSKAIEADPGFALGHAGLSRARTMVSDMAGAQAALADAQGCQADARERAHIAVIDHLMAGNPAAARRATDEHVIDHPRDAMIAQLCTSVFSLIGFSGSASREAESLAFTAALLPHYGDDWWMMSMHAISLCETGALEASAELMERSLAMNPRNANGAHFKAHEQYEAGETKAGRAYLADWIVDFDDRSALHTHLSWHLALWALHEGDFDAMWAAVDGGVKPGASKGLPINVLTDTAAILWRAQMAGCDVAPERWQAISDYAAKFFPETGQSFCDMHAALAHAMAGEGDRLAYIADTAKGFAGDAVKPVARAWGHIARDDWQGALEELAPVMHGSVRLGGSRAQRDLLELTYANVLLKLGKIDEAHRALSLRRPVLAPHPPLASLH